MTFLEDRRRRRSEDPLVALHYQLTQARLEGHFEAIVIADDAGVVVAGAGAWALCEELAAYAPLLAQGCGRSPVLPAKRQWPSCAPRSTFKPWKSKASACSSALAAAGDAPRRWIGLPKESTASLDEPRNESTRR